MNVKPGSNKPKANLNSKPKQNNNSNNNLKRKREDEGNNQKGPNPKKQKIENNPPKGQNNQKPSNNIPKSPVNNNKTNNNSGNFQRTPSTITNQKPQQGTNTQSRNETRGGNLFGSKKRAPVAPSGFLANKIKSGSDPKNQKQTNEPKKDQNKNTSSIVQKAQTKLDGAHFRWINEQLYTTTGDIALKLFTQQPELFHEYHKGFESQVKGWPSNPVDIIIKQLEKKPPSTVIADFGCGNAKIGQTLKQKVYSLDLVAHNEHIIVCDIANVPLPDASVDVAVFSLSLMGTNYVDFLLEANRVLKVGGELKIAEVKSRFDNIPKFLNVLRDLGYDLMNKDESNKMFVLFNAKKTDRGPIKKTRNYQLKPCKYKKR